MKNIFYRSILIASVCGLVAVQTAAIDWTADMKEGKVAFKSAGPIAFGPDGILFVADTKAAAIYAIATRDIDASSESKAIKTEDVGAKIAALLGTSREQILITDMAVNPVSHSIYLSVSRGRGPDAAAVLIRVKSGSNFEVVSMEGLKSSRAELPDAPADADSGRGNPRLESITDIAFFEDRVLIAGLSNEEFSSTFRAIPFPFKTVANGTSVEIYHGSHGRFETRSPVRTFVPFKVGNEAELLAAYTCTPLVELPLSELKPGAKVKGKTIAELGNHNRPIDMIVYAKNGKDYLLLANSARGLMKISTDHIEQLDGIVAPVPDKKGLPYETIEGWSGIEQLDRLDEKNALVLRRGAGNTLSLESMALP